MVGSVEDTTKEDIHKLFDLNLVGPIQMISAVMPYMREKRFGKLSMFPVLAVKWDYLSEVSIRLPNLPWTKLQKHYVMRLKLECSGYVTAFRRYKTNIAESRIKTKVSEAYKTVFNKIYELMNAHVDEGTEPSEVAAYVVNLLDKKKLESAHYYFGKFGQKDRVPLKWILPQNFYENLMRKYSKMD